MYDYLSYIYIHIYWFGNTKNTESSWKGRLCRSFCKTPAGNLTTTGRGIGRTPPVALSEDQVRCCCDIKRMY